MPTFALTNPARFPLSKIEEAYRVFENKEDGVIKIAIYNE